MQQLVKERDYCCCCNSASNEPALRYKHVITRGQLVLNVPRSSFNVAKGYGVGMVDSLLRVLTHNRWESSRSCPQRFGIVSIRKPAVTIRALRIALQSSPQRALTPGWSKGQSQPRHLPSSFMAHAATVGKIRGCLAARTLCCQHFLCLAQHGKNRPRHLESNRNILHRDTHNVYVCYVCICTRTWRPGRRLISCRCYRPRTTGQSSS